MNTMAAPRLLTEFTRAQLVDRMRTAYYFRNWDELDAAIAEAKARGLLVAARLIGSRIAADTSTSQ